MEISTAAIMSIVALVVLVAISCVNEDLNVGFLGRFCYYCWWYLERYDRR